MKITKTKKNTLNKPTIAVLSILIISLLGLVSVYAINQINSPADTPAQVATTEEKNDRTVDENRPTEEQIEAGTTIKQGTVAAENQQTSDFTTSVNVFMKSDTIVHVDTNINSVVTGTCTLTLTSGSNKLTYTTNIAALSQYSTCMGFDIPTSDFTVKGTWQIKVEVMANDSVGSATSSITL